MGPRGTERATRRASESTAGRWRCTSREDDGLHARRTLPRGPRDVSGNRTGGRNWRESSRPLPWEAREMNGSRHVSRSTSRPKGPGVPGALAKRSLQRAVSVDRKVAAASCIEKSVEAAHRDCSRVRVARMPLVHASDRALPPSVCPCKATAASSPVLVNGEDSPSLSHGAACEVGRMLPCAWELAEKCAKEFGLSWHSQRSDVSAPTDGGGGEVEDNGQLPEVSRALRCAVEHLHLCADKMDHGCEIDGGNVGALTEEFVRVNKPCQSSPLRCVATLFDQGCPMDRSWILDSQETLFPAEFDDCGLRRSSSTSTGSLGSSYDDDCSVRSLSTASSNSQDVCDEVILRRLHSTCEPWHVAPPRCDREVVPGHTSLHVPFREAIQRVHGATFSVPHPAPAVLRPGQGERRPSPSHPWCV